MVMVNGSKTGSASCAAAALFLVEFATATRLPRPSRGHTQLARAQVSWHHDDGSNRVYAVCVVHLHPELLSRL